MKITAVKSYAVHPGWRKNLIFVKVETDAGIHGWGEAYSQYDRDRAVMAQLEALGPYLVGRSPFDIKHFTQFAFDDYAARRMPVGGSVSASAINKVAGARSRQSLLIARLVMAVVIVAFGQAIGYVAMPALAGLLMLIGVRTVKLHDLRSVWRTGSVQKAVLVVTFVLTMIIPLQFAVLVGVGLSVVMHTIRQSNQISIRRWVRREDGQVIETDLPAELPPSEVVVLQPYGSLFFAAAPVFEAALPAVGERSRGSVVILRLRGRSDLGTTFMDVLHRYATSLDQVGSKLVIVSANERIREQLAVTGITDVIGATNVYEGDERVGAHSFSSCRSPSWPGCAEVVGD